MELRQLRYFVAVAEELHFRRAAERLYVAQPAVSEQIRKLEVELGVQVFDRTRRGVRLTPAGEAFLEEARRVLRLAESAQLAARNAHSSAGDRLRLGYSPAALPEAIPRALRRLSSWAPRIEASLETDAALSLLDAVRDARLDAAVTALPAPVDGLRAMPLGDEYLIAAVPVSDDRALELELPIERLGSDRLLVPPKESNPAFHNAVVALCHDAGMSPTLVELAEPRIEHAMLAVASGGGMALLPRSVRERHASPGVRLVDVAAGPVFTYAVVTRPNDDRITTRALLNALGHAVERAEPADRALLAPVAA